MQKNNICYLYLDNQIITQDLASTAVTTATIPAPNNEIQNEVVQSNSYIPPHKRNENNNLKIEDQNQNHAEAMTSLVDFSLQNNSNV